MVDAETILHLVDARRNVLLAGAPGTGKSMLLSEVASRFESAEFASVPSYNPHTAVPIPPSPAAGLPARIGAATNRKVFWSVLHQSSKHRDFLTGIMPDLRQGTPPGRFRVTEGILYRASEFAKQPQSAALLIIDEVNRGPAVQVFGGAIVAMEAEKRLGDDGQPTSDTQFFDLLDPATGDFVEYTFPSQLYILAAMNQADVSVEPLDVAFLRRWAPISLEPSIQVLRDHFGLTNNVEDDLPTRPKTADDVFEAAVRAFAAINERIALGRGPEFRIGHGVLMQQGDKADTIDEALQHFAICWRIMKNHVDEAFFGDVRGTAIVLNADHGIDENPYVLEETSFGDAPRARIVGPVIIGMEDIYNLLLALAIRDYR